MRKWFLKALGMSFTAVGIYIYLYYGNSGSIPDLTSHFSHYLLVVVTGAITGLSLVYLNQRMNEFVSWKKSLGYRFLAGFLGHAVVVVVILAASYEIAKAALSQIPSLVALSPELAKLAILLLAVLVLNGVMDLTFFSYREYTKGRINQLKHEREQMELQYDLLKTQLSPHYLFNSLNTISSLLDDSPAKAEQFIRRLVQSYQYLIASQDKKLVTVEEELEFVRAYLFLQKVRFGNALIHTISVGKEKYKANIPPLTIQLLVENVIKHNDFSELDPMEIVIQEVDDNYICVNNESRTIASETESLHVGLHNIQRRYSFFTNLPIRIVQNELFSVSVPLLP